MGTEYYSPFVSSKVGCLSILHLLSKLAYILLLISPLVCHHQCIAVLFHRLIGLLVIVAYQSVNIHYFYIYLPCIYFWRHFIITYLYIISITYFFSNVTCYSSTCALSREGGVLATLMLRDARPSLREMLSTG